MRYLRGETLGLFCGELGIQSSARVAISHFRRGMLVWDLNSGMEFNVDFKGNSLACEHKPIPENCFTVFQETDWALLARFSDPELMPWSEEHETLLSELEYRNLVHEKHRRYPLRELFASLCLHLGSKLHLCRAPHASDEAA